MTRPVLVYLAICYGLAIALGVVVAATGGTASPFAQLGLVAMFFPAIAVLILSIAMKEKAQSLGWSRFPLKYLPLALLLIPLVMHFVMLPLAAALEGGVRWQGWLTPGADGLYHSPEARAWGTLTAGELAGRMALNASVGLIVVSVLAFFEEVGWRAWLLPRLAKRVSVRLAVVAGAALWAFWHTPFALSGIHHLDGIPIAMTTVIMPVGHIGAGMVIGWLWVRTTSIWMVMLAHGALNNWGQFAFKFMEGGGKHDAILLLAGNLALLVVGGALVVLALPRRQNGGQSTEPSTPPASRARTAAT